MSDDLIGALKQLTIQAGKLAARLRSAGLIIERKADSSPVTNADKAVSELIYQRLQILTPDILVVCEERPLIMPDTETFWLVDPIDGTEHYLKGQDSYTINIGLIRDGQPTIGLIYQPEIDKLYYTDSAGQLKIQQYDQMLAVEPQIAIAGHKRAVVGLQKLNTETREFFNYHKVHQISYVAGAGKLCLVAEGSVDISPQFNHQTMEWDIAAGHCLILATGGNIVDLRGQQITYRKANFTNGKYLACSRHWFQGLLND